MVAADRHRNVCPHSRKLRARSRRADGALPPACGNRDARRDRRLRDRTDRSFWLPARRSCAPPRSRRHQGALPACAGGEDRGRTEGCDAQLPEQRLSQSCGARASDFRASVNDARASRSEGRHRPQLAEPRATAEGRAGNARPARPPRRAQGGVIQQIIRWKGFPFLTVGIHSARAVTVYTTMSGGTPKVAAVKPFISFLTIKSSPYLRGA